MVRSLLMLWCYRRHEFVGPEQQMESEFFPEARLEWDERYGSRLGKQQSRSPCCRRDPPTSLISD
jgi:hypothetical protein